MARTLLELKNVSKHYAGVRALDGVDFSLQAGEVHCLVGENGSGKSTLIKVISGVEKPETGAEMRIDGNGISFDTFSSMSSIDRGIHVIYQDLSLFPNLTVAENIGFNMHVEQGKKLVNWKRLEDVSRQAMDAVGIEFELDRLAGSLSIADQQLVAICRALVGDLTLLVMDEPTSSLTRNEVNLLFKVVKRLKSRGITTLFVSHKLNEVFEIAENVTVLRDGKKVGNYPPEDLNSERLTYLMTGKKISYASLAYDCVLNEVLLQVKGLTKRGYFKDIDLQLHKGEVLGITGLLGSGRTELALALFGMYKTDGGEIFVNGKPVRIRSNRHAIALGISYVPEDRLSLGLVMPQPVGDNIVLTVLRDLLNSLNMIDRDKRNSTVQKWVREMSIKVPTVESAVMTLSGGNQQKVVLAKWIATDPKILILDEPTVGIDVAAKASIHELIRQLARNGIGIILISDEIPEVLHNCHHVLVMRKGRLVASADTSTASQEDLLNTVNAEI